MLQPDRRRLGRRRAVDRERIGQGQAAQAVRAAGFAQVQAELFDDVAADLGDGDAQADLIEAANGQRVHDFGALAAAGRRLPRRAPPRLVAGKEAGGDVERLLRFARRGDGAGQDDRAADGLDVDVVARYGGVEKPGEFADVAADRDLEHRNLAAVGAKREDRRLSGRERRDVNAARRADDRVGDFGLADEDFAGVLGQVDDHRAADAELNAFRAGRGDRDRRLRVGVRQPTQGSAPTRARLRAPRRARRGRSDRSIEASEIALS